MNRSLAVALIFVCFSASFSAAAGDAQLGKTKAAVCAGCHGLDGNSTNPVWPKLAGQHAAYLKKSLRNFRSGVRKDPLMNAMAKPLSDADIDNLAAYFSSQKHR